MLERIEGGRPSTADPVAKQRELVLAQNGPVLSIALLSPPLASERLVDPDGHHARVDVRPHHPVEHPLPLLRERHEPHPPVVIRLLTANPPELLQGLQHSADHRPHAPELLHEAPLLFRLRPRLLRDRVQHVHPTRRDVELLFQWLAHLVLTSPVRSLRQEEDLVHARLLAVRTLSTSTGRATALALPRARAHRMFAAGGAFPKDPARAC